MKIGIITELSMNTVNYGNNLQAYALNHYLNTLSSGIRAETILFYNKEFRYVSVIWAMLWKIQDKRSQYWKKKINAEIGDKIEERFRLFQKFVRDHIILSPKVMTWDEIQAADYDALIVGSDIVWEQLRGKVNRIKFFDFSMENGLKRIAYAASFGVNHIPKENHKLIHRLLKQFDSVSVRECGALEMLKVIGIKDAVHVCDPVMLLSKEEWISLEKFPEEKEYFTADGKNMLKGRDYVFAYFFACDDSQKKFVQQFCEKNQMQSITIPYINGFYKEDTEPFGDINISDCGPQEWIWLVHHAKFVVTDSFHGLVFSVIFQKNFFVIKRGESGLNDRLYDFLLTAGMDIRDFDLGKLDISDMEIDYAKINHIIYSHKADSEKYLKDALFGNMG